jgi:mono/diheme cytochrome c family protein
MLLFRQGRASREPIAKYTREQDPQRTIGGVMSVPVRTRALFVTALFVLSLAGAKARAQENLDQNKSGPMLFAASCVTCHKSARGLAKGRMSFTLSSYLRQHYTSSATSAQILTAYLQSVDTPPAAKAKRAAPKTQTANTTAKATTSTTAGATPSRMPTGSIPPEGKMRPPATIPGR